MEGCGLDKSQRSIVNVHQKQLCSCVQQRCLEVGKGALFKTFEMEAGFVVRWSGTLESV